MSDNSVPAELRLASINQQQLVLCSISVEQLIEEGHSGRLIWQLIGRLYLGLYHAQIEAVDGPAGRANSGANSGQTGRFLNHRRGPPTPSLFPTMSGSAAMLNKSYWAGGSRRGRNENGWAAGVPRLILRGSRRKRERGSLRRREPRT